MRKAVILYLALAMHAPILAENWQEFTGNVDGSVFFIDKDSIRDTSDFFEGKVRRVWVGSDHSKNKKVKARTTKTHYHLRCAEGEYKVMQWIDYNPAGQVIDSWVGGNFEKFRGAAPGTVAGDVLQSVCDKA